MEPGTFGNALAERRLRTSPQTWDGSGECLLRTEERQNDSMHGRFAVDRQHPWWGHKRSTEAALETGIHCRSLWSRRRWRVRTAVALARDRLVVVGRLGYGSRRRRCAGLARWPSDPANALVLTWCCTFLDSYGRARDCRLFRRADKRRNASGDDLTRGATVQGYGGRCLQSGVKSVRAGCEKSSDGVRPAGREAFLDKHGAKVLEEIGGC